MSITPLRFTSSIVLLFSCLSLTIADHAPHPFPSLLVNAIYQFGDSLSDPGNRVRVNPSFHCGNVPYGETSFDKPTGRCSDGFLIVDYFAKFLNLPLIDEYLKKDGDFKHGVNFAVSGATALNVSILGDKYNVSSDTNLTLSVQLSWFNSHLRSFYPNASDRKKNVAKALFLVGEIGGNDYNFAFYQGKTLTDVYKIVPDVIKAIRNTIEELINLGATQIAVPGNFPIGCVPLYLSLFKTNVSSNYDEYKCLKHYNEHSQFHNRELRRTLKGLQNKYPNASIVYMDYYGALQNILHHPTQFGFDAATIQEACCGVDDNEHKVNIGRLCGTGGGVPVCNNPNAHISWDGVHLTQHAYQVIAEQLMQQQQQQPINGVGISKLCWDHLKLIGICFTFIWLHY